MWSEKIDTKLVGTMAVKALDVGLLGPLPWSKMRQHRTDYASRYAERKRNMRKSVNSVGPTCPTE